MTATAERATITKPTDREIRIERAFDASRDRVWDAYTRPELLAQWWGRGNKVVVEKFEAQRGGHWRFVEHHDGGTDGFEGRFREVTPKDRIVQTFEWDGHAGLCHHQHGGVQGSRRWADQPHHDIIVL